ncbi:MAG: GNAT family N-acetyltransferase [Flavobacteriales bacterium]|nr:GNAT family N-acetyltransferase [Flavobacteriales bacterium]
MSNFERMMQLAEEVFAIHDDPTQLQVDQDVLARLHRLHPATRGEVADADGPIAWVLVIPTTMALMEAFLAGKLTEHELYERTPEDAAYQAIYLCSVMVLPEHQRKGLARQVTRDCISRIREDHPITALFCWPFTTGGNALAKVVAAEAGLPLHMRER